MVPTRHKAKMRKRVTREETRNNLLLEKKTNTYFVKE